MKKEDYKTGAAKLMVAGFIVRIFGFVNRIFLSNLLGAEGMGLYQLSAPVYFLIILTLTAGISVCVSGMCASEMAYNKKENAIKITKIAFWILFVVGSLAGIGLAFFSREISVNILHDIRVRRSLVMLCPCIPIVASASAIKGYFYGTMRVTATAISQIVEQVVRIAVIFLVAPIVVKYSLEMACAIATVSAAFGEMANLLVVGIAFAVDNLKYKDQKSRLNTKKIIKDIVRTSFPISANRLVVSVIGMIEAILLPLCFAKGGLDTTSSLAMLGRISGMCMPLITFPTIVTASLSTTLVPAICGAVESGDLTGMRRKVCASVTMSLMMGAGFFAVFSVYGKKIGELLYNDTAVGILLCELSVCCLFIYLQQVLSGILNGLKKQTVLLVISITGCMIRIAFILFAVPYYGVEAYTLGTSISMLITSAVSFIFVLRFTKIKLNIVNWIIKPAIMFFGVYFSSYIIQSGPFGRGTMGFVFSCLIACLTALCLLVTMNRPTKTRNRRR